MHIIRIVLLLTATAIITAASAFAQMPACDGDIAMVRLSAIKPGGTMQNFLAAVAAQKAWYRANGVKDNEIFAARIVVPSSFEMSDTEVFSYHLRPPSNDRIPNRGDAAWKAFVKLFQDNSEIKNQYMTCMPKEK